MTEKTQQMLIASGVVIAALLITAIAVVKMVQAMVSTVSC